MVEDTFCMEKKFGMVNCFAKVKDNAVLCGCGNGQILIYDPKTRTLKSRKNRNIACIKDFALIDEKTIVSCEGGNNVSVWKLEF